MKNIKVFSLLFLFVLGLNSCSSDDDFTEVTPDPSADFSFESVADNPQIISFTNLSVDAKEFMWDFGDEEGVSTQKHPSYEYAAAGNYTVKLTVVNGENTSTFSQEVSVVGNPSAAFTYEVDQEDPLTIHFENESQNVTEYAWDFGDESEISSEDSPSHTYAELGTYTVTLTATGAGGTAEASMEVEVKEAQPDFSNIYIVGDASDSGWNIGSPAPFTQSENNPFVFVYEGVLNPGNIKFSTFTGETFCDGQWINSPEADLPTEGTTGFMVTNGCDGPDNKWTVTDETRGRYIITIDLEQETVKFEKLNVPYSELYAIGDAAPNGWAPQNPSEAFNQDAVDPFIFTYEAYLSPGELKFSTFKGEWCDGVWINAPQADADIVNASEYYVRKSCDDPDNKWRVTSETEGNYLITVDFYNETILFEAK